MIAVEFVNEEELRSLISLAAVGEALLDHGVEENWVFFYDALDEYMGELQYSYPEPFNEWEDLVDARMGNYKCYKDYVMLLPKEDDDELDDGDIDSGTCPSGLGSLPDLGEQIKSDAIVEDGIKYTFPD